MHLQHVIIPFTHSSVSTAESDSMLIWLVGIMTSFTVRLASFSTPVIIRSCVYTCIRTYVYS